MTKDFDNSYSSDGEREPLVAQPEGTLLPEAKEPEIPKEPTYTIIVHGTTQGNPLLVDERGFRYGLSNHESTTSWQWACSHRDRKNGKEPCRAKIIQKVSFRGPIEVRHFC